jgi:hypothetical protein
MHYIPILSVLTYPGIAVATGLGRGAGMAPWLGRRPHLLGSLMS